MAVRMFSITQTRLGTNPFIQNNYSELYLNFIIYIEFRYSFDYLIIQINDVQALIQSYYLIDTVIIFAYRISMYMVDGEHLYY